MTKEVLPRYCRGVRHAQRLTNCIGAWHKRYYSGFTLIELVVVFGLILILTGLVLSTAGYARKKGARARAETEIAALSAALESYKADNAIYPTDTSSTDILNAQASGDPSAYQAASLYLYKQLSGDTNANLQPPAGAKIYFTFKAKTPQTDGTACSGMLSITRTTSGNNVTYTVNYICDPFGNSYGYSTIQAANPGDSTKGYNPTFDLWSTAGLTSGTNSNLWIKNW
jgi:type II secretory pathway pseudopilin PulG